MLLEVAADAEAVSSNKSHHMLSPAVIGPAVKPELSAPTLVPFFFQ